MLPTRRTISFLASLAIASAAFAGDPQPGAARPLLKQLNEETESLYHEIQAGVVRVQLPPPKWAGAPLAEQDNPLHKWGDQLDADVKRQLEQEQLGARKGQLRKLSASVATAVTTRPATQATQPKGVTGSGSISGGHNDT